MFCKRLELRNFRNYTAKVIEFKSSRIFISGANGIGKTNVIEAINYLAQTRSFKKAEDLELVRQGQEFAAISTIYEDEGQDHQIDVIIKNKGRVFTIDNERKRTASEVLGNLLTLVYDPSMVFLFKEDPQARRKMLDETISPIDSQYLYVSGRYRKYLKERNQALLKGYDRDVMKVLTTELIKTSYRIALLRAHLVERLSEAVRKLYKELSGSEAEILLSYKTNASRQNSYEEYREEMLRFFDGVQSEEVTKKMTLIGVHRDDILATINGLDLGVNGSQGQNRLVTVAIKLAIADLVAETTGKYPILLFDDLASDLDSEHLSRLIGKIEGYAGQVIITGCSYHQTFKNWEEIKINNKENQL